MQFFKHKLPGFLLSLALLGCGGTQTNNNNNNNGNNNTPTDAGPQGNNVVAIRESANSIFANAVQLMLQHDTANDWAQGNTCATVANRFRDAANANSGHFSEAWLNRGIVLARCGQADEARTALQNAINDSKESKNCRARAQLGVLQYRAGQKTEARTTLEAAIADEPNTCVEGFVNLAMIRRETATTDDERREAVGLIRKALAADDKYIPALNQLALLYLADAGDDPRARRLTLARLVCQHALGLIREDVDRETSRNNAADGGAATMEAPSMSAEVRGYAADIWNTLGLVNVKLGKIAGALVSFAKATELNPNLFEAYMNFGSLNLKFRGYTEAKPAFERAVALQDGSYEAHIGLGVAYRGMHKPEPAEGQAPDDFLTRAENEYKRAQQLDPNRPDSYYNIGVLKAFHQAETIPDYRAAMAILREAVAKSGSDAKYETLRQQAQQHINQIDQIIAALEFTGGGTGGDGTTPPPEGGGTADGGT